MKIFKILSIFIFLLMTSTNILAQDQGGIDDFEILPAYLINGKVKIDGDNSTTTFKYKVTFVKRLNPAWYNGSGLTKWLFTTVNFRLISSLQNLSPYYMEDNRQITIADFPQDDVAFMTKEYTTTIINSYLVAGRTIDLSYQTASMPSFGTKSPAYQFEVVISPPVIDTIPKNIYEYWSPSLTDHIYTTDPSDPRTQYGSRSVAFKAFSDSASGTDPIYSYWYNGGKDHYYTTTNASTTGGGLWIKEGIAFYAYATSAAGRIPVYEYYNSTDVDHYYSTTNTPTAGGGLWTNVGIAFYALP